MPGRWSVGGADQRALLQERLALGYELLFWIYLVLFGTAIVVYARFPGLEPERVWLQHGLSLASLGAALVMWMTARRDRALSAKTLLLFDAAFVPLIGIHFATLTYLNSHNAGPPVILFVYSSFALFARTLLVPSSARQTAVIAGAVMACWLAAMVGLTLAKPPVLDFPPIAILVFSGMLAFGAVLLATAGSAVLDNLRRQWREATRVTRYELIQPLGKGAVFFRARHPLIRRPLALELCDRERADDRRLRRFERQIELAADLAAPGATTIFDYGRSADGALYCVRELVFGIDLERLVQEDGAQPSGRVIAILADVCELLAEAHARGLVHRELSPSRILLRPDKGRGELACVVGFGAAAAAADLPLHPESAADERSPFAAPETLGGAEETLDASDLYAVGAIGWLLATGAPPPQGRVEGPLGELLGGCLEEEPEDRPVGAGELGAELQALSAAAEWDAASARSWWRDREPEAGATVASREDVPPRRRLPVDLTGRGR